MSSYPFVFLLYCYQMTRHTLRVDGINKWIHFKNVIQISDLINLKLKFCTAKETLVKESLVKRQRLEWKKNHRQLPCDKALVSRTCNYKDKLQQKLTLLFSNITSKFYLKPQKTKKLFSTKTVFYFPIGHQCLTSFNKFFFTFHLPFYLYSRES